MYSGLCGLYELNACKVETDQIPAYHIRCMYHLLYEISVSYEVFINLHMLFPMQLKAGLNQQIHKWFLNNAHMDRKALGTARQYSSSSTTSSSTVFSTTSDDEESDSSIEKQLVDLKREMRRHSDKWNVDNIAQLLSATYMVRTERNPKKMVDVINEYPCFEIPLFVSAICLLYST